MTGQVHMSLAGGMNSLPFEIWSAKEAKRFFHLSRKTPRLFHFGILSGIAVWTKW